MLCDGLAAGVGWHEEDEVDYDLDEQDRQWLTAFNKGQERLPYRRMELLLWRLDTANAEATDSAFASERHLQLFVAHVAPALRDSSLALSICFIPCDSFQQGTESMSQHHHAMLARYSPLQARGCNQ